MKSLLFILIVFGSLSLFSNCQKEKNQEPDKQYLFDELPYYLADTLFVDAFNSMKMLGRPYYIKFDSKGYAWILDTFGLLYRYNRKEDELLWWNSEELLGQDVPKNVRPFFIDSRDRIWVPQYGNLYLLEGKTSKKIPFGYEYDAAFNLCEDSKGLIHFFGLDSRKKYVCDGSTATQVDPVFTDGDYQIYGMANDNQGNIWYNIDLSPSTSGDEGMFVVKYQSDNSFVLIPELQNNTIGELVVARSGMVFDSKNNLYMSIPGYGLWYINENNEWQLFVEETDKIDPIYIFMDSEDQVWANLSTGEEFPYFMSIVKDSKWIVESGQMAAIRERNSVTNISFPDENTVWVCTSKFLFEFKK